MPGKESACCPNCYCYVCDIPASKCDEWASHCKATHTSAHWRDARARKRNGGAAGSSSDGGAAAGGGGGAAASSSNYPVWVQRWSCDRLLKEVEQVYPVEHGEPTGLLAGTTLRPYQKQSLAFMLHVERNGHNGKLAEAKPAGRGALPFAAARQSITIF